MKRKHVHRWGRLVVRIDTGYAWLFRKCKCGTLDVVGDVEVIERILNAHERAPKYVKVRDGRQYDACTPFYVRIPRRKKWPTGSTPTIGSTGSSCGPGSP